MMSTLMASPLELSDTAFLYDLLRHEEISPYADIVLSDLLSCRIWLQELLAAEVMGWLFPRVLRTREGTPVGFATLSPLQQGDFEGGFWELGTWLHPDFLGRGYNASAKQAMLSLAFAEADCHTILLFVTTDNLRALAALRKLPYVRFDVTADYLQLASKRGYRHGRPVTIHAIHREDWHKFIRTV